MLFRSPSRIPRTVGVHACPPHACDPTGGSWRVDSLDIHSWFERRVPLVLRRVYAENEEPTPDEAALLVLLATLLDAASISALDDKRSKPRLIFWADADGPTGTRVSPLLWELLFENVYSPLQQVFSFSIPTLEALDVIAGCG